jgi:hypothetical protein
MVPLTGFVRVPLPSIDHRIELTESLIEASAEIRARKFEVFEKERFIGWLMDSHEAPGRVK